MIGVERTRGRRGLVHGHVAEELARAELYQRPVGHKRGRCTSPAEKDLFAFALLQLLLLMFGHQWQLVRRLLLLQLLLLLLLLLSPRVQRTEMTVASERVGGEVERAQASVVSRHVGAVDAADGVVRQVEREQGGVEAREVGHARHRHILHVELAEVGQGGGEVPCGVIGGERAQVVVAELERLERVQAAEQSGQLPRAQRVVLQVEVTQLVVCLAEHVQGRLLLELLKADAVLLQVELDELAERGERARLDALESIGGQVEASQAEWQQQHVRGVQSPQSVAFEREVLEVRATGEELSARQRFQAVVVEREFAHGAQLADERQLVFVELVVVQIEAHDRGGRTIRAIQRSRAEAEAELVDGGDGVEAQVELQLTSCLLRRGRGRKASVSADGSDAVAGEVEDAEALEARQFAEDGGGVREPVVVEAELAKCVLETEEGARLKRVHSRVAYVQELELARAVEGGAEEDGRGPLEAGQLDRLEVEQLLEERGGHARLLGGQRGGGRESGQVVSAGVSCVGIDGHVQLLEVVGELDEGVWREALERVVVQVEALDTQAAERVGVDVRQLVAAEYELVVEYRLTRELGHVRELFARAVDVDVAVDFDAALAPVHAHR